MNKMDCSKFAILQYQTNREIINKLLKEESNLSIKFQIAAVINQKIYSYY